MFDFLTVQSRTVYPIGTIKCQLLCAVAWEMGFPTKWLSHLNPSLPFLCQAGAA